MNTEQNRKTENIIKFHEYVNVQQTVIHHHVIIKKDFKILAFNFCPLVQIQLLTSDFCFLSNPTL